MKMSDQSRKYLSETFAVNMFNIKFISNKTLKSRGTVLVCHKTTFHIQWKWRELVTQICNVFNMTFLLSMLGKILSWRHFEIFFYFFKQKVGFYVSCKLSPRETIRITVESQISWKRNKRKKYTVDSRYLEFQGTLIFFEISVLRHIRLAEFRKKWIEPQHLTNVYICNLTPEVRDIFIIWKYCGKEEKLLLRSNYFIFPLFYNILWPVVKCSCLSTLRKHAYSNI